MSLTSEIVDFVQNVVDAMGISLTVSTESTAEGFKTRRFDNIVRELELAYQVHAEEGSYLGGVHLELTGENVTECTGGARGLTDADLAQAYKSAVDPRLNYEQAMEIAMRIAGLGR